jgi:hypothetical protein
LNHPWPNGFQYPSVTFWATAPCHGAAGIARLPSPERDDDVHGQDRATMFAPQPAWLAPPRLRPHSLFVAIALPPTCLGCRLDRSRRHQLWLRWPVHAGPAGLRPGHLDCIAVAHKGDTLCGSQFQVSLAVAVAERRANTCDGVEWQGTEAMVCETPAAYEIPTTSGTPNSGRDTAPY